MTIRPSHRSQVDERRLFEALLRNDLATFIGKCFGELNPAGVYLHNWHIDALAWHLGEVSAGRIKRLVITMPPRSLKSLAASIALPAFLLGRDPGSRIITVTYGGDLGTANANGFRAIVRSAWFESLFPAMRIDPRKDTEAEVRTTRQGYRLNTTVGGVLTGRGGNIIVVDDPTKAADAASATKRQTANTWFNETLLSRLDDKKNDAIIVVMQRLHVDDLAGHVLEKGGWTHLNLPAIAETDMIVRTGANRWHHRRAGEVLHPEREPLAVLMDLKEQMGSSIFSAQYQQSPVPPGGDMIKWKWFGRYQQAPGRQSRDRIVISWDTASKSTELSDYSVGVVAHVRGDAVSLLDVVRARLDYPDLKRRIITEKERWKADTLLIEDKGSGMSLIQDLRESFCYAIPIQPDGDKIVRMSACSARIEAGSVFLPMSAPWLSDFQRELSAFPNSVHDDQADALSQLLNWLRLPNGYDMAAAL